MDLLQRCACLSFAKQRGLNSLVGDRPWRFDLKSGELSFGADLVFPAQVLGTESYKTGTWLWSWANPASGIPDKQLILARKSRTLSPVSGIEVFTKPQFNLSEIDGHKLSMISSVLLGASAYYRGPYEGGAVYLLLEDHRVEPKLPRTAREMQDFFDEFTSLIDIPVHEAAYKAFLDELKWAYQVVDGNAAFPGSTDVTTVTPDGVELHVYFDEEKTYIAVHKRRPG